MPKLSELTEELKTHLKVARDIADTAEKENRDFTDDERAQVTEAMGKASDVKKRIEQAKGDAALTQAMKELGDGIGLVGDDGDKVTASGLIVPDGGKTLGDYFVNSAEYGDLMASVPGGAFQKNHRVQARPVGFKNLLPTRRNATLVTGSSDTSAGALVQNDYKGLLGGLGQFERPLRLRDVVTPGQTDSDTVEYSRVTSVTNNASPVAESTQTATPGSVDAAHGVKPESALALEKVTANVRTIAHWIPVTKRALSDAAQIRTLIDGFLQYGLEEELEDQMISGDGTGENLDGLANVSGVQTQAYDTSELVTLRKAKTKVRTVGRAIANAYLINPTDLETVDLLQDNNNQFYFGGPSGDPQHPIWALPVVETEAVPAGTAYVGDFRKAILWDREQSSITMTDSHADFFIRNMVAILAEMRAAFGVIQPNAFVKISLTPSS